MVESARPVSRRVRAEKGRAGTAVTRVPAGPVREVACHQSSSSISNRPALRTWTALPSGVITRGAPRRCSARRLGRSRWS